MQTRAPNEITTSVLEFCSIIVVDQEPCYVEVKPLLNQPANECFNILPAHVAAHGGKQIFGWAIWEWPKVVMEAEFHTVWLTSDGLIDISPREIAVDRILFLPDPNRQYEGRQVDNIRKPLGDDDLINRYCQLAREYFLATNEGDLAYAREVPLTPKIMQIVSDMAALQTNLTQKYR